MQTEDYTRWIGRKMQTQEQLATLLCNRMGAIFNAPVLKDGADLPYLWHWSYFVDPVRQEHLGNDGHPAVTGFIPGIPGLARMWAGGRVRFISPLKVGDVAIRQSQIMRVTEKTGRTGKLVFVTVRHEYYQHDSLCIDEEQDLVYRPAVAVIRSPEAFTHHVEWTERIVPTSVLLFRYSAVTFNAHRIHYDWPYATGEEHYPQLILHGPLIATFMLHAFIHANPDKQPVYLAYRGLRPVIADQDLLVSGCHTGSDKADLWAHNSGGVAHQAELHYR